MSALAFTVMGSLFAGRSYLYAAAWLIGTIGMAVAGPWAPVFYGGLMAGCSVLIGFQLRGIDADPASLGGTP